ncbi:S49 family peptidase [Marinicauda sp. Alg238-R41]|uniref:S49 family peptidase n=1 Tax=Marinicauda sp. Alg238-R41 TaxID=2993447 RepID=UPI0022E2FAAF|nr:S49 family peptidase [Marinicauda sp. Alg238-R41]
MPSLSCLSGYVGRPLLLAEDHGNTVIRQLTRPGETERGMLASLARLFAGSSERRSPNDAPRTEAGSAPAGDPADPAARAKALYIKPASADRWEYEWGYLLADGVALIDVDGMVDARGDRIIMEYWCEDILGYDHLTGAILRAAADDRVGAIGIRIECPGGDASGLFDFCGAIASVSARAGGKPIWAYTAKGALSAGYGIAAACDKVFASGQALVGSIGAVAFHIDTSKAAEKAGIAITAVKWGENKTAEMGIAPVTDDALARMQSRIDELGETFAEHVAEMRGIDIEAIRAMNANIYLARHRDEAQSGLALGLVDEIASEAVWFDRLRALANGEAGTAEDAGSGTAQTVQAAASARTPLRTQTTTHPQPKAAAASAPAQNRGVREMDKAKLDALTARMEGEGKKPEEILAAIKAMIDEEEDDGSGEANAGDGEEEEDGAAAAAASAAKPGKKAGADLQVSAATVSAIMDLPEASRNPKLAAEIVSIPGMTVAKAKSMLMAGGSAKPGFPGEVPDPGVKDLGNPSQAQAGGDLVAEARALAGKFGQSSRLRQTPKSAAS